MELERVTSAQVAAHVPAVLLVPVGSCEQHGPHLPLDTDTRIAVAVARSLSARTDGVMVAPPVAYGSSGEHQSFAGTLSIGAAALTTLLVEVARSALPAGGDPGPFGAVVFVNGHGGNAGPVNTAVRQLRGESRAVTAWSPRIAGGDAHAGRTETSLLLAIAGDVVGADRPVGNTAPVASLIDAMRAGGVAAVAPDGVLGDARGASAAEGYAVLDQLVGDLAVTVGTVDASTWKRV